jgi:phosphoribosylformylglycinamidine synthase
MSDKTDGAGKARVFVTLKDGVLDPQGQAVASALLRLGFSEVAGVRIGKFIEISLKGQEGGDAAPDGANDDEKARLAGMCERLLANPVIEDFRIEYGE